MVDDIDSNVHLKKGSCLSVQLLITKLKAGENTPEEVIAVVSISKEILIQTPKKLSHFIEEVVGLSISQEVLMQTFNKSLHTLTKMRRIIFISNVLNIKHSLCVLTGQKKLIEL